MIKIIPYILYVLLIGLHQVITKDATAIYSSAVNLSALLVLLVAVYKSELVTVWFGFVAGLVTAAEEPSVLGWQALVLTVIGLAAFHVRERLNLESLYAKLILILAGVFVHNVVIILLRGGEGFFFLLLVSAFPGAVYTMVIAWLFFLIKEKKITLQKVKAIF